MRFAQVSAPVNTLAWLGLLYHSTLSRQVGNNVNGRGKGLGKGGAKRHRKVLRDNIQEIRKPAIFKAISTLHKKISTTGRWKVSAVKRGSTTGSGRRTELASSGGSVEPANRCWVYPSATGEQAASSILQPGSSGVGATYPTVLAATQPRLCQVGRLSPQPWIIPNPVPMETPNRHMSNDISGSLSGSPNGDTSNAQVANAFLPAGQRPNKTPIFISGVTDARAFLAQLKLEKLMVIPSTADGFRAAVP